MSLMQDADRPRRSEPERRAENMPPVESFPVVRRGRLLRATAGKKTRTFSVTEGEKALRVIANNASKFQAAIDKGLNIGAEKYGFDRAVVTDLPEFLLGKSAHRNASLGAIYDFSERALDLNGAWLLLSRSCVTVCVRHDYLGAASDEPVHSKVWTRFILARKKGGGDKLERAINLPIAELKRFDEMCATIGDEVTEQLKPVYAQALSKTANTSISISSDSGFHVFALGYDTESFGDLQNHLADGKTLSECKHAGNSAARKIAELGSEILKEPVFGRANDDLQLIIYKNAQGDRGIFLGHFSEGARDVKLVGIAQNRIGDIENTEWGPGRPVRLSTQAANAVTAGLTMEYGVKF